MLVLSMNTKRQRRPNVRLGEIGDVSAAFACGFSHGTTTKEKLGYKRWKSDFVNPSEAEQNLAYGFSEKKDSELTISDPGISPRNSSDSLQNRENKNPNSSRVMEFTSLDQTYKAKSELDFGNITRKCRVMKRRGQNGSNGVFGSAWGSKLCPEFSGRDRKEYGGKEFEGYTFNVCDEYYNGDGFQDVSDRETPATSKEAYEDDAYGSNNDQHQNGDFEDYWNEDVGFEENDATKCGGVWDEMRSEGGDTSCVRTWLEELGFGKYADAFEMHEVDEEALLLLTLEDLKEMGIFAVGPRRKLYNAIQQLRGGDLSA